MTPEITIFRGRYSFLSNFYPVKIQYLGFEFSTSEHAYQAAKCESQEDREAISKLELPGEAKNYVRQPKVKIYGNWNNIKLIVMEQVLQIKFDDDHPDLQSRLLRTGNMTLVEGNTWGDVFWGVCPPINGTGKNHLGKLLMKVRAEILERKRALSQK